MTTVLHAIADWASAYRSTPGQRALAVDAIIDTLACIRAGRDEEVTRFLRRAYPAQGGSAPVIGGGSSTAAAAAVVNGTAAHAIDFDDNFRAAMSHASAVIVPAVLAVAAERGATGRQIVDAYLVALQAQGLIGSGLSTSHYTAGWHGTSTIGTIGTAAGIAWLEGQDATGLVHAMSLGVSMASGTKAQFGADAKPFHAGMAAKQAVEAARLSASGLRGQEDVIERDQGFLELFGGATPKRYDIPSITPDMPHYIETVGVMPKGYACCGSTHMAVDMVLDLMAEHGFDADDVAEVAVHVRIANFRNLPFAAPSTEAEARFSMHYCIVRALRAGRLSLRDFTAEGVAAHGGDPALGLVSMTHYTAEQEAERDFLPHLLTLTLRSGEVLRTERRDPRGSRSDPFGADRKRAKFVDCCADLEDAGPLYERLTGLEAAKDPAALFVPVLG